MSTEAISGITEYDDESFVRTAVVVPEEGTSFDLVDSQGTRIAEINAFVYYDENNKLDHIIVDVIDKDDLFTERRALTFENGRREILDSGRVVSADFRKRS